MLIEREGDQVLIEWAEDQLLTEREGDQLLIEWAED